MLCVIYVFTTYPIPASFAYTDGMGLGNLVFTEKREIAKGVFLDSYQAITSSGSPEKAWTLTFNPASSDAMVQTHFGDSVNSRKTLTSMITSSEAQGNTVIGGINGDFYYLINGVPLGIMIKDGVLVSNNGSPKNAIGFRADGSAVIGTPDVKLKGTVNNNEFVIGNFNKAQNEWGPFLFTSDFGPNTGSTVPSLEIVVDIVSGKPAIGQIVVGTVSEVKTSTQSTPIGKNQMVFSAQIGKNGHYVLSQLKKGDTVSVSATEATGAWNNVTQAMGGDKILIKNGIIDPTSSSTNINPTTAIGVKANGEVVFFETDGRDDAVSTGISSMDAAKFLYDQGCVDAIQLDGGGSSTLTARIPGNKSPEIVNIPSDGRERPNSNGFILISKQGIQNGPNYVATEAKLLHIYPLKAYALPGASIAYKVTATDDAFFPAKLPDSVKWMTNAGTIDATGKLTAEGTPGSYLVGATNNTIGSISELNIVEPSSINQVKPVKAGITLLPGTSVNVEAQAYINGLKVQSKSSHFTWQVEGNIGTITPDGVFTAIEGGDAKGKIRVSLGTGSATIDVTMAQSPITLEEFENGSLWAATGARAKTVKASIETNPALALFGSKMLRLDYDFTLANSVETGTAGAYVNKLGADGKTPTGIVLEKNPTAIGMWVYGDNSRNWIRARIKDATGQSFDIDFTKAFDLESLIGGIDWTGWKYVEAKIPAGKQAPYTLETPLRVMCTRDEMRTRGTIYVDRIRAIYGLRNDDTTPPVANVTAPQDGAIEKSGKVPFKAELIDNVGIDAASVQVFVDGLLEKDIKSTAANGKLDVSGTLGSALPLADGLHVLDISFADKFGNKAKKSASFRVDTGAPQILGSTGTTAYYGGNFNYTVQVMNPKTVKKVYLSFSYDNKNLEVVDADPKTKGIQVALEAWVKKGKVINNTVDPAKGKVLIEVENLSTTSAEKTLKAATITFKNKTLVQSAKIGLDIGAMIVGQNKSSQRFCLPVSNVSFTNGYLLTVQGYSAGETSTIMVRDRAGNPIEGASIYVNDAKSTQLKTDSSGYCQTKDLTAFPAGTEIRVKADKAGMISNTASFKVADGSTGLKPLNLTISYTGKPDELKFTYRTAFEQTGTVMQLVEKKSYLGSFAASPTFSINGADAEIMLNNGGKAEKSREHSVILPGLQANTAYLYRFLDASGKASPVYEYTFQKTTAPYTFLFLTDPQGVDQGTYTLFSNLFRRGIAKAGNPAFAVLTGDLVDNGASRAQWDYFFKASEPIFSGLPIMTVAGNHEYYDDPNLTNYKSYFGLPQNGPDTLKESCYSFTTGDALFMVLDTQKSLPEQIAWMEKQVAAFKGKWRIVLMHRGIYSGYYDEADLRKVLAPAFDKLAIDLVLSGHDHTYLRSTMKAGKKVALGAGTTYLTGGSSGKKYYDAKKRTWTDFLYDTNNPTFTTLQVSADKILVVSSHVEGGKTVDHDRFEIKKP